MGQHPDVQVAVLRPPALAPQERAEVALEHREDRLHLRPAAVGPAVEVRPHPTPVRVLRQRPRVQRRAAELSRATVHLIEAGICDPRLSTITRLAVALQMDTLDLLTKRGR